MILIVIVLAWGYVPSVAVLAIPLLVVIAAAAALGVSSALSAINVRYRDVRYVVPFAIQMWLFASPVAYPSSLLDEPWRTISAVNPMVGVVEGFRWAVLGTPCLSVGADRGLGGVGPGPADRRPRLLRPRRAALRRLRLSDDATSRSRRTSSASATGSASTAGATGRYARAITEAARRPFRKAAEPDGDEERSDPDTLWALNHLSLTIRSGEVVGADRPQRRRQEHPAEDPLADHRADQRLGRRHRPGRLAARGRHRLPPRADRSREHLPQRLDPGHATRGDPRQVRRDRRLRRDRALPRHPGQALLERDVGPARLCGRGPPRARDPARRRGARGRRRLLPAQVARRR